VRQETLCIVDYVSDSGQTYRWVFYNSEVKAAIRTVAKMVVASGGDLTYGDALIINEMIRDTAGYDS
jgi:hypothetical protein